eukprot:2458024-Lingulodinium_polyedra.AAC.1
MFVTSVAPSQPSPAMSTASPIATGKGASRGAAVGACRVAAGAGAGLLRAPRECSRLTGGRAG